MKQTASQKAKANTSVNQVPGLFKKLDWSKVTVNLDWGGGKFNKGTEYLSALDVQNVILDPYARPEEEDEAWYVALNEKVDNITCSNVLNVLKSKAERTKLLKDMWLVLNSQKLDFGNYPPIYFTMYEKNKDGVPDEDLPQTNMRTAKYIPEISAQFPETFEVSLRNKIITVKAVKR